MERVTRQCIGGAAHHTRVSVWPHLQHKAKRSEDTGRHRNAHNIVDGGKDEVKTNSSHSFLGEVQAAHHIYQVILQTIREKVVC